MPEIDVEQKPQIKKEITPGGKLESPSLGKPLEPLESILNKITVYCIYIAVALLPLFFYPSSFITHELPKQALLMVLVGTSLLAWLANMALSSEIRIRRSIFDAVVLIFWASQIISTIGSVNPSISIWGFYGRGNLSLISTTLFVGLYFLIINNFYAKKDIIRLVVTLLASSAAVAIISAFQIAGIFVIPFAVTKAVTFNPIGSTGALVMFLIPILAITVALLLQEKGPLKLSLTFFALIIFGIILSLNVSYLWWSLLASLLITGVAAALKKGFDRKWLALLAILFILSLATLLSPNFGLRLGSEVLLDRKIAWQQTMETVKDYPAFGSGPETFIYDFSNYRPKELNKSLLWTLRFDKAGNEYFTILSTNGVLGFLSYLALIIAAIGLLISYIIKERDVGDSYIAIGLVSGIGALAISSYFLYSNTASALLLWLFFAFSICLRFKNSEPKKIEVGNIEARVFTGIFMLIGLILTSAGIYYQGKALAADVNYRQGLIKSIQARSLKAGIGDLKQATELNPQRDNYNLGLASALLTQANLEGRKKKLDAKLLQKQLSQAISNGQKAVSANPLNVANWEALAIIYRNAGLYVSGAMPWIEKSYQQAINLEPTNPLLYNGLGQVYLTQKQYKKAEQFFKFALNLKKDFADGYYNLGLVYKLQKKPKTALDQFNKVLKLQPNNQLALKEKRNIKKKIMLKQNEILQGEPSSQEQNIPLSQP